MSAPSLEVLLAQAGQLRGAARLLASQIANRAGHNVDLQVSHLAYAYSSAIALDALCSQIEVGLTCERDNETRAALRAIGARAQDRVATAAAVAADPRA